MARWVEDGKLKSKTFSIKKQDRRNLVVLSWANGVLRYGFADAYRLAEECRLRKMGISLEDLPQVR